MDYLEVYYFISQNWLLSQLNTPDYRIQKTQDKTENEAKKPTRPTCDQNSGIKIKTIIENLLLGLREGCSQICHNGILIILN